MKNKLFMFSENTRTGKIERFYYIGGQTIQEHNQILINEYNKILINEYNKIYVTTMYRYSNRESHSYVVYAGFNKDEAIEKQKTIELVNMILKLLVLIQVIQLQEKQFII